MGIDQSSVQPGGFPSPPFSTLNKAGQVDLFTRPYTLNLHLHLSALLLPEERLAEFSFALSFCFSARQRRSLKMVTGGEFLENPASLDDSFRGFSLTPTIGRPE